MPKKSSIILASVSALALLTGLVVSYVLLVPALPASCPNESIDSVPYRTSIPVMTPAVLPDGYSFQYAVIRDHQLTLKYFDGPACGKEVDDGVLQVIGEKLSPSHNMTATQYVDSLYEQRKDRSYMKEHYIFDDKRHAYAVSYSPAEYYMTIGDDSTNTLYTVISNLEPDEVEAIAKSLYEVKVVTDPESFGSLALTS